jgi:hypothetical protein
MRVNKVQIGFIFVLVVLVFSTLTLLYWDFMRDTIIVPIYYLFWVSDLMLKSVPQGAYLAFLIFICVLIGWNTLSGVRVRQIPSRFEGSHPQTDTRYAQWKRLYSNLHSSPFARDTFAWEARKLILSILAYQDGIKTSEVEAMVKDGTLPLPDSIRDLIQQKKIRDSQPTLNRMESTRTRLRRLFFKAKLQHDPQIDTLVAEIVSFIEHQLEIDHAGNQSES